MRSALMKSAVSNAVAIAGLGLALSIIAACNNDSQSVAIDESQSIAIGSAQVTISSHPFRMRISDSSGRVALSEITNLLSAPMPYGANSGFGSSVDSPPLYSPLTFMVGIINNQQFPGFMWGGNQIDSGGSGTLYAAKDVTAMSRNGDKLELTLSTNDPSGRIIKLVISPGAAGTIRVQATPIPSEGVVLMSDSFDSSADEAFHGFGGRHNALDQHGQNFYNWIEQENIGLTPNATTMFPNGPTAAYHVHGSFVSSHNYGFLLNHYEISRFRLDSDRPDAWQIQVAAPRLDYSVFAGTPTESIAALTSITGRQRVAPGWAMGPILDRSEASASFPNPTLVKQQAVDDLANIKKYNVPVTGYRLESWSQLPLDTVRQIISDFKAQSIHVMLYYRAFLSNSWLDADPDLPGEQAAVVQNNYAARDASGAPYRFLSSYLGEGYLIDFSNPQAVSWWQQRIRQGLDLGADGFMQDFGEQATSDMHFWNGQTGSVMHNRYPVLYHAATRALFDQYQREHPERELFFFTRSGYTGTADEPGSLAYDNANFLGDSTADYSRIAGIGSQITDMLNRGIGGAYGSTVDIGGYFDMLSGPTTKELFIRWAELSALTPFYRVHTGAINGTSMPWDYDQETVDIFNKYARLHIAALPLIRSLWQQAVATGIPMMRPLWLEFPGDAAAAKQDQEFMLGPDVLVAPVVTKGATSREVYLPAGCWQAQPSGAQVNGPIKINVSTPLDVLPYFFRCGKTPFPVS